eukprot:Pgem_evm1s4491
MMYSSLLLLTIAILLLIHQHTNALIVTPPPRPPLPPLLNARAITSINTHRHPTHNALFPIHTNANQFTGISNHNQQQQYNNLNIDNILINSELQEQQEQQQQQVFNNAVNPVYNVEKQITEISNEHLIFLKDEKFEHDYYENSFKNLNLVQKLERKHALDQNLRMVNRYLDNVK